jgi:hypothetical protein
MREYKENEDLKNFFFSCEKQKKLLRETCLSCLLRGKQEEHVDILNCRFKRDLRQKNKVIIERFEKPLDLQSK